MAGTIDIVLRCLTGMLARGDTLRFDPALPAEVKHLRFSVHYRGNRLNIRLAPERMRRRPFVLLQVDIDGRCPGGDQPPGRGVRPGPLQAGPARQARAFGLADKIGADRFYPTLPTALDTYRQWTRDHPKGASS